MIGPAVGCWGSRKGAKLRKTPSASLTGPLVPHGPWGRPSPSEGHSPCNTASEVGWVQFPDQNLEIGVFLSKAEVQKFTPATLQKAKQRPRDSAAAARPPPGP